MQQDRRGRAGRRCRVDEGVGPGSRRQHQCTGACQERLGRLAVEGHDANVVTLYFYGNDIALAGIDEAESQPLMGVGGDIERGQAVDRVEGCGVLWISP